MRTLEGFDVFLIATAGILWSLAFIVVGLGTGLQLYADGSIFSYAIADRSTWAFHWHNIPQRLTIHVLTHAPAEAYVAMTGHGRGGIVIYGLLFFAAPFGGLVLTRVFDRTPGHVHYVFACFSTALLVPLVFGFPTELWLSLALLWPVMASLHGPKRRPWPVPLVLLLALAFTHEGGLLLAVVAVGMLALRGGRDEGLHRGLVQLGVVVAAWLAAKIGRPPDDYFASAYARSAAGFLDFGALVSPIMLLVYAATLAAVLLLPLERSRSRALRRWLGCGLVVGLIAAWLLADLPVHAAERYTVRTVMLGAAALLAVGAALVAQGWGPTVEGWCAAFINRCLCARTHGHQSGPRVGARSRKSSGFFGAGLLLVLAVGLVHVVETARFVHAWGQYKDAVRVLAMSEASDPKLGDPRFVDAERLGERLNRLSWYSTTHYLSVLLTPGWVPKRLVVDPEAGYYWLSCAEAKADEARPSTIPRESRELIRVLSCRHR